MLCNNSKMTDWHKNWQIPFEHTEIPFKNIKQIKNRRCDILIDDHIVEVQHSSQTEEEANNRYHDYTTINNKQIIWILDGKNCTVEKKNNRIIIEIHEQWKINSYKKWEFIFLDINDTIYKIYSKSIKNKMIDCNESYLKNDFINFLKNDIQQILNINIPNQCNLYLKQQGAGNGKTYGIIQQINNNDFEYDNYILITKHHSATFNIYDEFEKQQKLDNIKNLKKYDSYQNGKKYIIEFERNNIKKSIIIGTVDSLFYSISNKYVKKDKYSKMFKAMVEEVCKGVIEEKNINNINYSKHITLHKKMCLIIDETQDLDEIYGEAIINIMKSRYIDCYIVGDLLQSISNENNAFNYLLNYQSDVINIYKLDYINNVRRFNDKLLIKFVNYMVDFEKYDLPKIENDKTTENINSLKFFEIEKNKDKDRNELYCEQIMKIYENEINNGYNKEDILIITPIVKNNKIMNALETKIRQYWNNKLNDNIYKQYAKFHKSEEGTSIDLNESKDSTRLISIHTSKGLGHKIVIVFDLNDSKLFKFSKNKKNLIYDSMIHVALTRMKEKLYILYENNNDNISNKIISFKTNNFKDQILKPNLTLNKNIRYSNIIEYNKNNDFQFNNDIEKPLMKIIEKLDSKIIDMGHHQIRYSTMISYILIKITHSLDDDDNKQQIIQLLKKINKNEISLTNNWKEYNKMNNIPLFQLGYKNNNSENKIYNNILIQFVILVKKKCKDIINKNIDTLCSFEMIVLHYLIMIVDKGNRNRSSISPIDIYNIINIYYKSFNKDIKGHNNCLCKKLFLHTSGINIKKNETYKYLNEHYDSLKILDKQFNNFIKNKKELKWLFNHNISLGSYKNNNNYWIFNNFDFICYTSSGVNDNVYFITLKPQLNDLNFIDNMIELYFNQHLIENINTYSDNKLIEYKSIREYNKSGETYNSNIENFIKFNNKKINPIIISLNNDDYITFDFGNIDLKEKVINSLYNYLISDNKAVYYLFKYYYKQSDEKNSNSKIKDIINNIKNYIKDYNKLPRIEYPDYLITFFNKIQNKIEDTNKSERKKYLDYYLDMDKFIKEYSLFIQNSINEYFIGDESSDEEE